MEPKSGIYIEFKQTESSSIGLSTDMFGPKLHAYLIYRKADGTTEVIRGGLNGLFLDIETGKSLEKSEDKYGPGETMETRRAQLLDLGGQPPENVWKSMRKEAERVGAANLGYLVDTEADDPDQTSNSVVAAALKVAGISAEKVLPHGVTPADLPGVENDLSKPIGILGDRTQRVSVPISPIGDNQEQNVNKPSKDGTRPDADAQKRDDTGDPEAQETPAKQSSRATTSDEARAFLDGLAETQAAAGEIVRKPPETWTKAELELVETAKFDTYERDPGDPTVQRLDELQTRWYDSIYGRSSGDARRDEQRIAKIPTPAATPDGGSVENALHAIGQKIAARAAATTGGDFPMVMRDVQRNLNSLSQEAGLGGIEPGLRVAALKVDGEGGPKTRHRLRQAVAVLGPRKVGAGLGITVP